MRFLGLFVLLAVAVLGPDLSESRTVSVRELKFMLLKKLYLPPRLLSSKAKIINIVVCEVNRRTRLQTDSLTVFGSRKTTTAKPTTTITMTTTASPPPNSLDDEGSGMFMTTRDQVNQEENNVDEGSGASVTAEDELNEEEDKFDEEQLMRDDNTMESDSSEEEEPGACSVQSNVWSLGYYGIFSLPDSHFCCSGYRWSRNVCKTDCSAFIDDDISDDVDCFVNSGFWRFLLRTASPWCWFHHNRL